MPRWLLLPLIKSSLRKDKQTLKANDVSLESLIPTQHFDQLLVKEMDGRLASFAGMRAEVLLLGGDKSPAFLHQALDALSETLPHVKRVEYAGLGHDGPNETAPERIGKDLRAFFSQSSGEPL
jgi:hypothetical protein